MSSMADCQHSFPAESTLCLQFESVLKRFSIYIPLFVRFFDAALGFHFFFFFLNSAAVHIIQFNPETIDSF